MKKELFINEKKRTTVTLLKTRLGRFVGKAKCNRGDKFDSKTGESISNLRAMINHSRAKEKRYNKKTNSLNKQAQFIADLELKQKLFTGTLKDELNNILKSLD